jgi:hypothetical protein
MQGCIPNLIPPIDINAGGDQGLDFGDVSFLSGLMHRFRGRQRLFPAPGGKEYDHRKQTQRLYSPHFSYLQLKQYPDRGSLSRNLNRADEDSHHRGKKKGGGNISVAPAYDFLIWLVLL